MAKQNYNCIGEHMMHWIRGQWECRHCSETILETQMNRIVERDVSTVTGHVMMIYPALIALERGR